MNFKLISSEFEIYAFQLRFRSKYYKKKNNTILWSRSKRRGVIKEDEYKKRSYNIVADNHGSSKLREYLINAWNLIALLEQ